MLFLDLEVDAIGYHFVKTLTHTNDLYTFLYVFYASIKAYSPPFMSFFFFFLHLMNVPI